MSLRLASPTTAEDAGAGSTGGDDGGVGSALNRIAEHANSVWPLQVWRVIGLCWANDRRVFVVITLSY